MLLGCTLLVQFLCIKQEVMYVISLYFLVVVNYVGCNGLSVVTFLHPIQLTV